MIKKDYQKPTIKVVQLQHQRHILVGSLKITSIGLDGWDEDGYDEIGGDQGLAW